MSGRMLATVDVLALARAISASVADVLHAHGYAVAVPPGDVVEHPILISAERMVSLLDELGRNAAQAALAPGVIDEIDELRE